MNETIFSELPDRFIEYRNYTKPHNMPAQHYHDSYEIYFLIKGERNHFIGNEYFRISVGDVMLVKPFELHYSTSTPDFEYARYVLNLKKSVLSSVFDTEEIDKLFEIFGYRILHLPDKEQVELYNIMLRLQKLSIEKDSVSKKLFACAAAEVLILLKKVSGNNAIAAPREYNDSEIMKAIRYINENYYKDITLDDVTYFLHMSKYHFCRVFKNFTGATFLMYLNNLRLTKAHQMLLSSKQSINEIALATGFRSTQNFTRVFKQIYGVSPSEFRKHRRTDLDMLG